MIKNFDDLTERGKARRLRAVALAALDHYDLEVDRVALLAMETNALFRVRTAEGRSYVIRLATPGWRTDEDLRAQVAWLGALARDTDVGAPVPVLPAGGDAFVGVSTAGVPGPTRCMVLSWVPGTPLGQRLSAANLAKMGALFARLHAHGLAFDPPAGFTTRRMSSYLARGEKRVLFSAEAEDAFTPESRRVFDAVRARVDAAFAGRYADPQGLRVIHNDLWHDNIKVHRGRLRPLDFEDTIWGYPVQDIAMAFLDLLTDVTPEAYETYTAAFRRGYAALAPWPERYPGEIDDFGAGRVLWIANYVSRYQREHLGGYLTRTTPFLRRFLDTGRLRKAA
jgi:Ser/Thr protein kinase RdoA (MazF antagonist)